MIKIHCKYKPKKIHLHRKHYKGERFRKCSAVGSVFSLNKCHLQTTVYVYNNLPPKYTSKLNNIYLVCLCNSDDIKSKHTGINNIWQLIVVEIAVLESDGIMVNGKNL